MVISAAVTNSFNTHKVSVQTNNAAKEVNIAAKTTGYGSSINGGELLTLALATCFCNDIYREAAKQNISVESVEVVCSAEFGAEGKAGSNFTYTANVISSADEATIAALIQHTDAVAEIHNTLRKGVEVKLVIQPN